MHSQMGMQWASYGHDSLPFRVTFAHWQVKEFTFKFYEEKSYARRSILAEMAVSRKSPFLCPLQRG